ncbi:hypothetical protein NW752_011365 [Fusarium irregulare]|uniref:Uncharacterized protein n=1 Tax=Fusarium irregulare TaxID=2494466 RepID=A0A9W8PFH5_9HYPO|nr:hypothetical protein LB507_008360 [Fusarium sp. FIESC RH6]KAJ4005142.1 hypothetical protein NW766_011289 [Fusarium irregulare]KAJ4005401.1 hypothetical protein NW752_011365 [Fusarium irregulare]
MTGAVATPRYSNDDFETASIRSAAPSYVSEAPSYHSINPYPETLPSYTPPVRPQAAVRSSMIPSSSGASTPTARQQTIGLPPVPAAPLRSQPNLNNFRIATWSSVSSNPAARHYQNVANRRLTAQRDHVGSLRRVMTDISEQEQERPVSRPLEDPYLVGEVAATRARQERVARETGEDVLIREDRHWDWFLARMKDSDDRQRSWASYRRDAEVGGRKKLFRRMGGRRLL